MDKTRILVVDDDQTLLSLVAKILERADYEVTACINCNLAFEALEKDQYQLIITDAIMPLMSGIDFVKAVKRNPDLKDVPVLMLTKKGKAEDVKLAIEAGVSDYLIKPVDEFILLEKVEICLKKRSKRLYEIDFRGFGVASELEIPIQIVALSETGMVLKTPFFLNAAVKFNLKTSLFKDIGIAEPVLRHNHCEEIKDGDGVSTGTFETHFTFVGLPETNLRKVRVWLHRESAKFKK